MTHLILRTVLTRIALVTATLFAHPAHAGAPEVTAATVLLQGRTYTATVTIRHDDTGWDHYADGWSVRLMDGTELGYRTLHHPHVTEQPFTRSLGGIAVPRGTAQIQIVPHDSVHGWGDPFVVDLN